MKFRLLFVCCLVMLTGACGGLVTPAPLPLPIPPDAPVIDVVADLAQPGPQVASDFMGLSFEITELSNPAFDGDAALVQLLRAVGPGTLRFGGNSVDRAIWSRTPVAASSAHPSVTPADLDRVFAFARSIGWHVILGLNLASNTPELAADEAQYAVMSGGDTLLALEIGNEPDLYLGRQRQPPWDYGQFRAEFDAYVHAIRARTPGAPITGPATTSVKWFAQLTRDEGSQLVLATHHIYPLWQAPDKSPQSPTYPSLDHLLSADTRRTAATTADSIAAAAAAQRLAARIGETNSVAGGGAAGISDVFGAALWGADYLLTLAAHGISGVNLHTGGRTCNAAYTPVCLATSGTTARPLYYGMLLFHIASQGRNLPVSLSPASANVTAFATVSDDGLHLTLLNFDRSRTVVVRLSGEGGYTHATLLRLTGPALDAKDGIAFGGSAVSADGRWTPGPAEPAISDGSGFKFTLPAASAAVVTLVR